MFLKGGTHVNDILLGHLLKANDPATQADVERLLATDLLARAKLERLRAALLPLAADREDFIPPADLVLRTLSRVAEHIVAAAGPRSLADSAPSHEMMRRSNDRSGRRPERPIVIPAPDPVSTAPRRRNVVAAIGLSAAVLALIFPVVLHLRTRAQVLACQDTMRQFHQSLVGYSDTNEGRFPKVPEYERMATVGKTLQQAGYLAADARFNCPAASPGEGSAPVVLANYAYSLGYRDEAGLHGLTHQSDDDMLPILADAPLRNAGTTVPVNHRRGQNVLYAGGYVRFSTTPKVGVNGDDIYCNANGNVGAGLNRWDSALGRAEERP